MAWKIKKGDHVYVITGDAKGSKGKVLSVDQKKLRVVVEGVNLRVRHVRPSPQHPEGGLFKRESPIHISNVALVDSGAKETLHWSRRLTTRVGFRLNEEGKKVRFAKRSGTVIEDPKGSMRKESNQ